MTYKNQFMNFTINSQKCALIKALLDGHTLDILNGMKMIGATNIPREVGRHVINPKTGFNARVIKKRIDITTQYGTHGYYFTYKLDKSEKNNDAVAAMRKYLSEQNIKPAEKTTKPKENKSSTTSFQHQSLFQNL
jgi:hypothetical protein